MLDQKAIDLSEHRFKKAQSLLKQAEYLLKNQMDFDYDDFVIPTEPEALFQFQNAQQLIAEVEQKRAKLLSGDLSLPEIP